MLSTNLFRDAPDDHDYKVIIHLTSFKKKKKGTPKTSLCTYSVSTPDTR